MKNLLLLLTVLILGFGGIFVLSRRMEKIQPKLDDSVVDEDLYFSGQQLNSLGHDFRGLIADWYWINSLQYIGKKLINSTEKININDLRPLNPRLLYPMLDTASTLDPKFITVYSYGAAVLPAIDNQQAIKLLEKGIAANPDEWRLYHNLGYIYWQLKDYKKASENYDEGSKKPNAPNWLKQMSANMQAEGGSREFARQVYKQMFETAEDEQTRSFAELRYYQTEALDQMDAINLVLQAFQKQNGRCANSWREISNELRSAKLKNNTPLLFDNAGTPVDPTRVPYFLFDQNGRCEGVLDPSVSKIPVQ